MSAVTTVQWLFFDLGWTLIDEMPAARARAEETARRLRAHGFAVTSEAFIERCWECGRVDARSPHRSALRWFAGAEAISPKLTVNYDHAAERLFDGVPQMLAQLARHYHLGVIANQSGGTEQRLRAFGIRDYFEVVLSSAEFGVAKPDPRIFAEAELRAGVQSGKLVMIGDRLDNDTRPAHARGWRTIRVRQGFSRGQEPGGPDERADFAIDCVLDAPGCLVSIATDCLSGALSARAGRDR